MITNASDELEEQDIWSVFLFETDEFKITDGTVELFPYQAGSEILKLGGLVFDAKGNKRSNIQYHLISGMAHAESDGKNTDVLEYPDRVSQEIHYLLKPLIE